MEEWRLHAACINTDPEIFFPGRGEVYIEKEAKRICSVCPVTNQCLDYALFKNPDCPGIWGGTTQRERRSIRARRRRAKTYIQNIKETDR